MPTVRSKLRTRQLGGVSVKRSSARRVLATALLVSVAYYVGAQIGLALRVPPSTLSVLWPPNAILTATLLLAPVRRWWIYLLAVFPAHLMVERAVSWPLALVLTLFVTICLEAFVAAGCVRRFSDAPARFDTLLRLGVFIGGAVLLAPFVSSFPRGGAGARVPARAVLARLADAILRQRPDTAHVGAEHRDGHHGRVGLEKRHRATSLRGSRAAGRGDGDGRHHRPGRAD